MSSTNYECTGAVNYTNFVNTVHFFNYAKKTLYIDRQQTKRWGNCIHLSTVGVLGMLLILLLLPACTAMPSAAPSRSALMSSTATQNGNFRIIEVDEAIARKTRTNREASFPSSFFTNELVDISMVRPGDTLSISIWENVDSGLFSREEGERSSLTSHVIPENGEFFFPYAGIIKTNGKTVEDIRQEITKELSSQTPEPQIQVGHHPNSIAGVTIFGDTSAQGTFAFDAKNRTLKKMLARTGALTERNGELKKIILTRNNVTGAIFARDLIDDQKYDIPLRPEDEITIKTDSRFFRVMGDGVKPKRVNFRRKEISALDALIENGGLDPKSSNISGILIVRDENRPFGEGVVQNPVPLRTAYILDLRKPEGVWTADMFEVRSGDIIYVSQASIVAWMNPVKIVTSALRGVDNLVKTTERY